MSYNKKKLQNNSGSLTLDDFNKLNENNLEYIKQLDSNDISERIEEISIPNIDTSENIEKAKKYLDKYGIFIIPEFYNEQVLSEIESLNISLLSEINAIYQKHPTFHQTDKFVVQGEERKYKSYKELSKSKLPIVSIRQGQDKGMIDIFNYDLIKEVSFLKLRDLKNTKKLNQFMNEFINLTLENINLYINKGVTKTRGFHYDDFKNTIKAFVYLRDVEKLKDGPYCFVKSSHKPDFVRKINQSITNQFKIKTEAPVVSVLDIIPVLAPKGSLVVSNQTGIHRGIPQNMNGYREVIVLRYM